MKIVKGILGIIVLVLLLGVIYLFQEDTRVHSPKPVQIRSHTEDVKMEDGTLPPTLK